MAKKDLLTELLKEPQQKALMATVAMRDTGIARPEHVQDLIAYVSKLETLVAKHYRPETFAVRAIKIDTQDEAIPELVMEQRARKKGRK